MRGHIFHVILAFCLVGGTWFATRRDLPATNLDRSALADPHAAVNVVDVRTGGRFWGLQLCGIVPCSTLVIKGGGHLVTFATVNDPDNRCFYHVIGEKKIELNGTGFQLRVAGPELIHVERVAAPDDHVAAR